MQRDKQKSKAKAKEIKARKKAEQATQPKFTKDKFRRFMLGSNS